MNYSRFKIVIIIFFNFSISFSQSEFNSFQLDLIKYIDVIKEKKYTIRFGFSNSNTWGTKRPLQIDGLDSFVYLDSISGLTQLVDLIDLLIYDSDYKRRKIENILLAKTVGMTEFEYKKIELLDYNEFAMQKCILFWKNYRHMILQPKIKDE